MSDILTATEISELIARIYQYGVKEGEDGSVSGYLIPRKHELLNAYAALTAKLAAARQLCEAQSQLLIEADAKLAALKAADRWNDAINPENCPDRDGAYFCAMVDGDDRWTAQEYYSVDCGWSAIPTVTHWMPIPELPQPPESEGK